MTKKITQLPAATTPLAGTELVEIVQGGVSSQVAVSDLGGGAGTPPGSDTQGIFNDGGAFGADAGWTYNKTTNRHLCTGGFSAGADPALSDIGLGEDGFVWWKQGGSEHPGIGVTAAGVLEIGATTGIPILIGSGLNQYITVEATEWAFDVTVLKLGSAASNRTLSWGTGAPGDSPADGSIYLRTDGDASTGIYTRQGGAWSAVGGGSTSFADNVFEITDNGDATKKLAFEVSGISTGTTRTWTVPNESSVFVGTNTTQTLTNKTCSGPSFTASSFLGSGGTIASAGAGRFGNDSGLAWLNAGGSANVFGVYVNSSNEVMIGTDAAYANQAANLRLYATNGGLLGQGGANYLGWGSTGVGADLIGLYKPLVGVNSPHAISGRAEQAMADANQTLAASVYSRRIVRFTGALSANRTATFPHPASEDASFDKVIVNDCTGNSVVVSTGTGTTVTVAPAGRAVLAFTPAGVMQIAS